MKILIIMEPYLQDVQLSGLLNQVLLQSLHSLNPQNVVCLKIHGMFFTKPAISGDVLKFSSKVVYAGNSSITSYIHVENNGAEKPLVDGFVTFIHVDENTRPCPHNLHIEASNRGR